MTEPGPRGIAMILATMLAMSGPAAGQENMRTMIRDRDLRVGLVDERDLARQNAAASPAAAGRRVADGAAAANGAGRPGYREPGFWSRVDNWWSANFRPSRAPPRR